MTEEGLFFWAQGAKLLLADGLTTPSVLLLLFPFTQEGWLFWGLGASFVFLTTLSFTIPVVAALLGLGVPAVGLLFLTQGGWFPVWEGFTPPSFWLLFLTQDGWLTVVVLFFPHAGWGLGYFELLLTLDPLLLRLLIQEGCPELSSAGLFLLVTQGGWLPEPVYWFFWAQGGEGVELLVSLRYWLMGLLVWLEAKVHQNCFGATRSYYCFSID